MATQAIPGLDPTASSGGNPAGGIKGTSSNTIDQMLQEAGIPTKGAPFMAFYFIILTVIMGKQNDAEKQNISTFAGKVGDMANISQMWADVRRTFMNGYIAPDYDSASGTYSKPAGPTTPGGTDTATVAYRKAIATFMQKLLEPWNEGPRPIIPGTSDEYPPVYFDTSGQEPLNPITSGFSRFEQYVQTEGNTPEGQAYFNQTFPVFGDNIVGMFKSMKPLVQMCQAAKSLWSQAWAKAWVHEPAAGGFSQWMEDPTVMQQYFDGLSNIEGVTNGVSASESSKLKYAQAQWDRLMAFAKNMLNDWCSQRKSFDTKMAQANN